MTLQEMSHTYRSQHAALRQRIRELTAAGVGEDTRGRIRIRRLEEMAKENRDLAALCWAARPGKRSSSRPPPGTSSIRS